MPISATGRTSPSREQGFTLVELLVVVTVIGLVSGLAVLTLSDNRPALSTEAERFAARLLRAREEAVITGRAVEVAVAPEGYSFARRRGAEREAFVEPPFDPVAWESRTEVSGPDDGLPARLVFDSTGGAAEPAEFTLRRDDNRVRVTVDGAGEVRVDVPEV